MDAAAPAKIGRYTIEATLGRGAMGVIYKAHDPVIDRPVAIKLVNADLLDGDERANYIARFRQEAQAAGRCNHPNIVGIYDYALHEGNPYLAMEFIDGITLNQMQRARPFTIPEIIEMVGQILDALHAAHGLGVIHRDIKPANIMLTTKGVVKVTDFGISRLDSSAITGAGSVVGTPSYMSPEQCRGDPVDARSDVFSTGVVLYELATGRKPFLGRSQHELWHALLNEPPPDPATLKPGLPAALGATIRRSLAKAAADRFASAAEMAQALRGGAMDSSTLVGLPDQATVILSRTGQLGSGAGRLDLDSGTLSTIERQLAAYIGPIASRVVRSAVQSAGDVDELCRTLASNIEGAAGRERFTREVHAKLDHSLTRSGAAAGSGSHAGAASANATGVSALATADIEAAQAELTRHVGPIARILVKRAASQSRTAADLWRLLSEHVEKPADRAAFLARAALDRPAR